MAGPTGPDLVSLDKAWFNLMHRIGVYGPKNVSAAAAQLNRIYQMTGMKRGKLPQ